LPRTGEESSLMTTLIGIVLLAVVLISGSLYRKFKQS
jgi:LPXTG-motif cell wall-anchored protein